MADILHSKYYALIADPTARNTYPASFEDPQEPFVPGGGVDGDFVSYDVDDAKNATEQLRARTNIGSAIGIVTTNSVDSNQNNLARPTNFIVFTGATALRNITGLVAGTDGEEVILWNRRSFDVRLTHDASSTAANRFSLPGDALFDVIPNEIITIKYDASISRWVLTSDVKFLRRDREDSREGTLTQNGALTVNSARTILNGANNTDALRVNAGNSSTQTVKSVTLNSNDEVETFSIQSNGCVNHTRSALVGQSARRDELPFNYPEIVATTSIINNLSLSDEGRKLLVLTLADELTGVLPVSTATGRELKIECRNAGGVIIRHDSASSTAANRFALPGATDLTINNGEVYTFIYTNGRWRRCL